jgi:hypothetical protein
MPLIGTQIIRFIDFNNKLIIFNYIVFLAEILERHIRVNLTLIKIYIFKTIAERSHEICMYKAYRGAGRQFIRFNIGYKKEYRVATTKAAYT